MINLTAFQFTVFPAVPMPEKGLSNILPNDIIKLIFGYLKIPNLVRTSLVCRRWNYFSDLNGHWIQAQIFMRRKVLKEALSHFKVVLTFEPNNIEDLQNSLNKFLKTKDLSHFLRRKEFLIEDQFAQKAIENCLFPVIKNELEFSCPIKPMNHLSIFLCRWGIYESLLVSFLQQDPQFNAISIYLYDNTSDELLNKMRDFLLKSKYVQSLIIKLCEKEISNSERFPSFITSLIEKMSNLQCFDLIEMKGKLLDNFDITCLKNAKNQRIINKLPPLPRIAVKNQLLYYF